MVQTLAEYDPNNQDHAHKIRQHIKARESRGSYLRDLQGNTVLDLHAGMTGAPLGYNHFWLWWHRRGTAHDADFGQGVDSSSVDAVQFDRDMREKVLPIAPDGLSQVCLNDESVHETNESAIKNALKAFGRRHGKDVSSAKLLSFDSTFHQTDLCDQEVLQFPQMKYPMNKFSQENRAEEDRVLGQVRESLRRGDVAAVFVEPVAVKGNEMATPYFYQQLRKLTLNEGVALIVDETKTGLGVTGRQWGSDHWYLDEAPDFVTFGGKVGVNGYYCHFEFQPEMEQGKFDYSKVEQFNQAWRAVQKYKYLERITDTGSFLKIELGNLSKDAGRIGDVRGYGGFLSFDVESLETAVKMERWFAVQGI